VRTKPSSRSRSFTAISPVQRELECVGEEVEDDLLPHPAIDPRGLARLRRLDAQAEAGALAGGAEVGRELGGERREVGRLEGHLRAPRLDAGEIQQRVHELQQALPVTVDGG
jgi:hypothetical protein